MNSAELVGKTLELNEQLKFFNTLAHDEFVECIIAGHDEDYKSWSRFIGEIMLQMSIPEQRRG